MSKPIPAPPRMYHVKFGKPASGPATPCPHNGREWGCGNRVPGAPDFTYIHCEDCILPADD